jgi:Mg-chelatase subunit ChlI
MCLTNVACLFLDISSHNKGQIVDAKFFKHMMCTNYSLLAWTLAHQLSGATMPAAPHNHPSRANAAVAGFNTRVSQVGREAIEAEKQLVESKRWRSASKQYEMLKEAELHDALNDLVGISTRVTKQTAQEDSSGSSDSSESSNNQSKSSNTRERSDSSESSDDGSEGANPGLDLDEHSFSQSDLEYAVKLVGGAGVGATYAAKRTRSRYGSNCSGSGDETTDDNATVSLRKKTRVTWEV